jgi:hypothetical protein
VTFLWGCVMNTPKLFLRNLCHMLRSTNMAVMHICSFVCYKYNTVGICNIGKCIQEKKEQVILLLN